MGASPLAGALAVLAAWASVVAWLPASASAAQALRLPVTGPPAASRMVFDGNMRVASVCLPVTIPAGGQSVLYGQRFTDGAVGASAYYKAHCGCDVTQLVLARTAHLFMVHRSLPNWVDHVVNWLTAHGLAGAR